MSILKIVTQSVNHQLLPLFYLNLSKAVSWCLTWMASTLFANSILIRRKVFQKMKPTGFALRWPCDPQPWSRSRYNVVVVNDSRNYGRCEKKSLKSLHTISILPDEHDWLHGSICYSQGLKKIKIIKKILKRKKQEERMYKPSTFAILTGLLRSRLPYIINHHEHFSCFMQPYNTMTTFTVSLWPWVNVKVIQTGIKLYSFVMFSA